MPPRGVRKGTKRARQYEKVKRSARKRGASKGRARELAARTVNKERARSGQSRTRSKSSVRGASPSRRGGRKSGTNRPKGQTKEQLLNQARRLRISGRSKMNKSQLARAVSRKRG